MVIQVDEQHRIFDIAGVGMEKVVIGAHNQEVKWVDGAHAHGQIVHGVGALREVDCPGDAAEFGKVSLHMKNGALFQFKECTYYLAFEVDRVFDRDAELDKI